MNTPVDHPCRHEVKSHSDRFIVEPTTVFSRAKVVFDHPCRGGSKAKERKDVRVNSETARYLGWMDQPSWRGTRATPGGGSKTESGKEDVLEKENVGVRRICARKEQFRLQKRKLPSTAVRMQAPARWEYPKPTSFRLGLLQRSSETLGCCRIVVSRSQNY